jgi:para-nitrobenzyl esterase
MTTDSAVGAPVETALGKVAGNVLSVGGDRVYRYLGIPYATPPVGPLRWRHAEPAAPWTGVRLVSRFAPDCPQPDYAAEMLYMAEPRGLASEDCLYLNIWTTAEPGSSREPLRPVMVWIHGGALLWGRSSLPLYDGQELARKGAVVVSFNYRLGIFGFFTHPELAAESPHGAAGNYTIGDQVAALRWVRDNIEAFGGDPGNVTIFGESGGSQAVHLLTASPAAAGLFHRAVGQSGPYPLSGSMMTLPEALAADRVPGATDETLSFLRDRPAAEILRRAEQTRFANFHDAAIVDGHVIHRPVREVYAQGRQAAVPLLLGCTANEATVFPPIGGLSTEDMTREVMWRPMLDWADLAAARQPVYFYLFSHVPPGGEREVPLPDGSRGTLGAYHTSEISFVFNNEHSLPRYSPSIPVGEPRASDLQLADSMSAFWVSFARYGRPTRTPAGNEWPQYDPIEGNYFEFCDHSLARSRIRDRMRCAAVR